MIEETVRNYLNSRLSVKAYMEEEPDMPEEYILIEKTGGGETNCIKNSTLTIQSFSMSLYGSAKLNEQVKKVMKDSIELDEICKCGLNSDYNYTDTSRKKYRYQAVFDIVHY